MDNKSLEHVERTTRLEQSRTFGCILNVLVKRRQVGECPLAAFAVERLFISEVQGVIVTAQGSENEGIQALDSSTATSLEVQHQVGKPGVSSVTTWAFDRPWLVDYHVLHQGPCIS